MPFADLHCHPSFWSFNKLRSSDLSPDDKDYHIWNITLDKKQRKKMEQGKRATYSQSDFSSLSQGEVMLVFAAMYPPEKGFFMGNRKTGIKADVVGGILNQIAASSPKLVRQVLAFLLRPLSRVLSSLINNEGWGRDILQKLVMNFSTTRINFFQDDSYDYFSELQKEYEFYKKFDGATPLSPALPDTKPYKLIRTSSDLVSTIQEKQKIGVVLTMEGLHALSLKPDPESEDFLQRVDDAELVRRIDLVKNEWRLFFITFSHHYSNHIAGHAHSLPKLLGEIADQTPLINSGFLPIAEKYIRQLLSITDQNDPDPNAGRRVLIDVKHFSALSRKDYYDKIIRPYNQKRPEDTIPVIASHCGYYGPIDNIAKVDLSYLNAHSREEDDDSIKNGFYKWNINLCDEDIQEIVSSGGLVGLSFDQRILGERNPNNQSVNYWINVMARHIIAIVTSAKENITDRPERIWNCLCIGTDFDGLIDPLDVFSTSQKFGSFKTELRRVLETIIDTQGEFLFIKGNPYTPGEVAEKIAFTNAYQFTVKHFK